MVFTFHPHQEAALKKFLFGLKRLPCKAVHLVIIQGPTGCGKSWMLREAVRWFPPAHVRQLGTDELSGLLQEGYTPKRLNTVVYMYGLARPKYVFICLDEFVNQCDASHMGKVVSWIQMLHAKKSVPITTVFFFTCANTFRGNAKKLWLFMAPKRKRKLGEEGPKPYSFRNIRLYRPKDYLIEKYVRSRGVRSARKIHLLQTLSGGDIRQLHMLMERTSLSFLAADKKSGQSTQTLETSIFSLVQSIYEGSSRLNPDGDSQAEGGTDCAAKCLDVNQALLKGVREPNGRIVDFLHSNRFLPYDKQLSLNMGDMDTMDDDERNCDFLRYQMELSDDYSFFDTIHEFDTYQYVDDIVRCTSLRTTRLNLAEYELDDTVQIQAPKDTIASLVYNQRKYRSAQLRIMQKCFWIPNDNAVSSMITRSNARPYIEFLGCAVSSADRNYQDLSDRLQQVDREDFQTVFPQTIRKKAKEVTGGAKKTQALFMPF